MQRMQFIEYNTTRLHLAAIAISRLYAIYSMHCSIYNVFYAINSGSNFSNGLFSYNYYHTLFLLLFALCSLNFSYAFCHIHCIACVVWYALLSMYCILCIVLCVLYSMYCTICIVLYSSHCIQCIVFYVLYFLHFILGIILYVLYCMLCL